MEAVGKSKEELDRLFEDLKPIKPVRGTEHLVQVFTELSARRGAGMNGPDPITFTDIDAYNRLLDVRLEPWEVSMICSMDRVYITESYKLIASERG